MTDIPDYCAGRLIYETNDGNKMRWVVYDGYNTIRFISRTAARRWCIENLTKATRQQIKELILVHQELNAAWQRLHKLSITWPSGDAERLEVTSCDIHKLSDNIFDIITASHTTT